MKFIINLLIVFYRGMFDSTSVIGHGYSINNRASKETESNIKLDGCFKFLYLPWYLFNTLLKIKIPRFNVPYTEVVYAGHTENNLKEFNNFYEWCKDVLDPSDQVKEINNYAKLERLGFYKRTFKIEFLKLILCALIIYSFLTTKIKLNRTSFDYVINYAKNFINYLINFDVYRRFGIAPVLLVLANDHNPKYVAISKVFKLIGTRRIYMQHGGVSEMFPPLDFEMSILFNEDSRNIYLGQGKTRSQILTISRSAETSQFRKKIKLSGEDSVNVVLVPSVRVNVPFINKVIESLKDNASVTGVYVKHHPRFLDVDLVNPAAARLEDFDVTGLGKTVFLTGNTTAALQLIMDGQHVYQVYGLDYTVDDYYGFVKKGLLKVLSDEELNDVFWDSNFQVGDDVLLKYCPILSGEHKQNIAKLNDYVKEILSATPRHGDQKLKERAAIYHEVFPKNLAFFDAVTSTEEKLALLNSLLLSNAITKDEYRIVEQHISTQS
jgi:hypothetical protein